MTFRILNPVHRSARSARTATPQPLAPAGRAAAPGTLFVALSAASALAALLSATPAAAQLPPVVAPPENPITEAKRVLGKILFWDEQLSSDNTVACGTCHSPGDGGADPRRAVNPGDDGIFGNADDVLGSFGVARRDSAGVAIDDPVFGLNRQVTGRAAPSFFSSLHAPELFWDGRASSEFKDPLNPASVLIASGGALESQSMAPILSSVEMARDGRTWSDVVAKLAVVRPLSYADDVPADMADAIAASPRYPALFAAAFGDDAITPARIAFAIATYERTLVPNQTPFDRFLAGEPGALTPPQMQGLGVFNGQGQCRHCHVPPLLTNNDFLHLGLRPAAEDEGRRAVSGLAEDFGDMKVPGLRNVGLRATLMHTGGITGIPDVINFYIQEGGHAFFTGNLDRIPEVDLVLTAIRVPQPQTAGLIDFLSNALTDPRVAAETFPFDRPQLAGEAALLMARCEEVARTDCREPVVAGHSPLTISDVGSGAIPAIGWKFSTGEATAASDFGDPTASDGLVLCMYSGAAADTLTFEGRAPADSACSDGTCWRRTGNPTSPRGYRYSSKTAAPDGVRKMTLKAGDDRKTRIVATLKGSELTTAPLGMPALPLDFPLTVQLQAGGGSCWSVTYTSATSTGNGVVATD